MNTDIKKPYSGGFEGRAHYFAVRVYFEDTDVGGVVYHANYLRFLERARSDLLRCLGIDQRACLEKGAGVYAVTEMQIKYCKPARFEDELVVVSHLAEMRRASCVIKQQIMRGDELLTDATSTVAFLNGDGRPTRQPAEWVKKFESIHIKPAAG
jgi:acyl-CoA thioester hydrolase